MTDTQTRTIQLPDSASAHANALMERIDTRTATVAIVGLGYVGLPLARAVHDAGFNVLGFDVDDTKVDMLQRGENYLQHLGADLTQTLADSDRFEPTSDASRLSEGDIVVLCVPTPLGKHREPDLSYVLDSTRLVAQSSRPGQLVVLESTTYPRTTRDEMMPILEDAGRTCGDDLFLAYSPEREDPGREGMTTARIPKIVGGIDDVSGDLAEAFYCSCIASIHRVRTAEIAEAAKLLENIYRAVNIAMVNELKMLLTDMDIDVWEVIDAAKTKPFGFQAFYPGPGLGGHCIPIDPFYLTWKAREYGRVTRFIELAGEVNTMMPHYVIERVIEALNNAGKSLRDANVLVIGVAYKPNVDDVRESPSAELVEQLRDRGANVKYHDPHVPTMPRMRKYNLGLSSVELTAERLAATDCVLIATDHDAVDWNIIADHAPLVVDTRNAMESKRPDAPTKATVVKA